MTVVRRLGVLSCGKMLGALYAAMGLLFGALFSLISLIGGAAALSSGEEGAIGAFVGVGAIIFFPIVYGIMGFLGGLLTGFLYNLVAGFAGGIEVELELPAGSGSGASYAASTSYAANP